MNLLRYLCRVSIVAKTGNHNPNSFELRSTEFPRTPSAKLFREAYGYAFASLRRSHSLESIAGYTRDKKRRAIGEMVYHYTKIPTKMSVLATQFSQETYAP